MVFRNCCRQLEGKVLLYCSSKLWFSGTSRQLEGMVLLYRNYKVWFSRSIVDSWMECFSTTVTTNYGFQELFLTSQVKKLPMASGLNWPARCSYRAGTSTVIRGQHLQAVVESTSYSFLLQSAAEKGLAKLEKYFSLAKGHRTHILGTGMTILHVLKCLSSLIPFVTRRMVLMHCWQRWHWGTTDSGGSSGDTLQIRCHHISSDISYWHHTLTITCQACNKASSQSAVISC